MAALPYMQLYVSDYLADTAHLTTEEHGAYLLLLFNYWQTGKSLRKDRLAFVARTSNERWISVEETLKEFFHDDGKNWVHFRVEADLAAVNAKSKTNSDAGKASARARAAKKAEAATPVPAGLATNVTTNVDQSLQRNVNHTDTDTDTEQEDQNHCPQQADDKPKKFSYQEIQQAYNEICPPTFPACAVMNEKRKKQIKAMGAIDFMGSKPFTQGIEVWRQYFTDCLTNPHWCGQNATSWTANFDFVTNPTNAIKLMERMN
ncbi:MAG: DUF1376 domain-containing protein [Microbacterium sp.]|uniref:YdaU family protein n=1 Tax=Microbacterium sp. TaxID=51671 RepID=UPI00260453BF|nr:DUF1376 domain-containing protein [Microbacterium sp.]MCV0420094.1 DUF1376 domain-containing protein [Microbacterium sp.]